MKDTFAQIKDYLPKFLSPEQKEKLFADLDDFPDNIDQRFYTLFRNADPGLFQGDGIAEALIIDLPEQHVTRGRCMVLSNTCDVSKENKRAMIPRLSYCPIVSLSKLQAVLAEAVDENYAKNFIGTVRAQLVTTMFYLPKGAGLDEEGVALLDHTLNCALNDEQHALLRNQRIFTLSNYGFYLLLFKISIHFTRIMDGVDRDSAVA